MGLINRVFFHELGHFVARELNCRLYDVPHPAAIEIHSCPEDRDEYCGSIIFDTAVASGGKPTPKERLAGYIAATTYGCIFQAYYKHSSLNAAQDKNGEEDIKHWVGALTRYNVSSQKIHSIEEKYFDYLIDNKVLDGFLSIVPEQFLEQREKDVFSVMMCRLREAIQPLLDAHYSNYQNLINELDKEIYAV
jgi:hypothetical protein